MRFSEFRLDEDDFGNELGDFIEDDADHEADAALVDTLREIQFSAGDKKLPKITVTALMNLVKNQMVLKTKRKIKSFKITSF